VSRAFAMTRTPLSRMIQYLVDLCAPPSRSPQRTPNSAICYLLFRYSLFWGTGRSQNDILFGGVIFAPLQSTPRRLNISAFLPRCFLRDFVSHFCNSLTSALSGKGVPSFRSVRRQSQRRRKKRSPNLPLPPPSKRSTRRVPEGCGSKFTGGNPLPFLSFDR